MEREIKFRAWHKDCMKYSGNGYELATLFDYFSLYEDTSLMQSTGLIDKNHKEIYEGDILKSFYHRDKTGNDIKYTQETVEIEIDNYCGKIGFEILFPENSEIIGNIYENPNLLTN